MVNTTKVCPKETATRYFEVLVVKFKQMSFFKLIYVEYLIGNEFLTNSNQFRAFKCPENLIKSATYTETFICRTIELKE
jgi:hypothetical protein